MNVCPHPLDGVPFHLRTSKVSEWPEHSVWQGMIERCHGATPAPRYGGRGITVCDAWRASFAAFADHVGPRPPGGYSIERVNNDGHYEPGNVKWATAVEQANNRDHGSKPRLFYTIRGVTRPFKDWVQTALCNAESVRARVESGVAPAAAMSMRFVTGRGAGVRRLLVSESAGTIHVSLAGTDGVVCADGATFAEAVGRMIAEDPSDCGFEVERGANSPAAPESKPLSATIGGC